MIGRQNKDPKCGWSQFNQEKSTINPALTTVGYMPLIINPAHDYDTLNTLVLRCTHIANILGQDYVPITTDEDLFFRLMNLKWSQGYSFLFPRLGGLHISMNFMKLIGQRLRVLVCLIFGQRVISLEPKPLREFF